MGRGNRYADINEVYVRIEAARKEQLVICLQHMEEQLEAMRDQVEALTTRFSNMGVNNVRHCQPRPQHAGPEDKFIVESKLVNPFVECRVRRRFPTTQGSRSQARHPIIPRSLATRRDPCDRKNRKVR
jgi:hypothetical protein